MLKSENTKRLNNKGTLHKTEGAFLQHYANKGIESLPKNLIF